MAPNNPDLIDRENKLKSSETLWPNEKLTSLNKRWTLENDWGGGEIRLYDMSSFNPEEPWEGYKIHWRIDCLQGNLKLTMQSNGILVARGQDDDTFRWSSTAMENSLPDGDALFLLTEEGNLVVTHNGKKLWDSGTGEAPPVDESVPRNRLRTGEKLLLDQSLTSTNGRFRLTFRGDSRVILYDTALGDKELYCIGNGTPAADLIMQDDANLVIHGADYGDPVWDSGTGRAHWRGSCVLELQDDGNLVIKAEGGVIWQTRTALRPEPKIVAELKAGEAMNRGDSMLSPNRRYELRLQDDRNLVLYDIQESNRAIWQWNIGPRSDRDNFRLDVTNQGEAKLWDDGESGWGVGNYGWGDDSTVLRVHDLGFIILSSNKSGELWRNVETRSSLAPNETLKLGDKLYSSNLEYALELLDRGIKISAKDGTTKWSQELSGCQTLTVVDTVPSKLEIRNNQQQVIWTARVKKAPPERFRHKQSLFSLEDDGYAYLWFANDRWWTTSGEHDKYTAPSLGDRLENIQVLLAGDYISSPSGGYRCTYREDGALAVTDSSNNVIWSSKTEGRSCGVVIQQNDGNLVICDRQNSIVFSSEGGYPDHFGVETVMQDDGNLVTTIAGRKIWASKGYEKVTVRDEQGLPKLPDQPSYVPALPAPRRPDWEPGARNGFGQLLHPKEIKY